MKESILARLVACRICKHVYIPHEEGSAEDFLCASCEDKPEAKINDTTIRTLQS